MIFNLLSKAKDLFYNNANSGYSATNVQDVIDEIQRISTKYEQGVIYDPNNTLGAYLAKATIIVYLDGQASTTKQFPCQIAGMLEVIPTYYDNKFIYVKQTYTARDNSCAYVRVYDHNTGKWGEWKQLY